MHARVCTKQVDTVYFKNPRMHEMDDGIGDIQAQITDKQVLLRSYANYGKSFFNHPRGNVTLWWTER